MVHCDYNIDRYVRNRDFDYLKKLPPVTRAAEKFRLETEILDFEIRQTDEIVGWFSFVKEYCPDRYFDEELCDEETESLNRQIGMLGSTVVVDRGHTLLNYENILRHGLIDYEKRIDEELTKYPENEYLKAMKTTLCAVKALMRRVIKGISDNADKYGRERARLFVGMLEKVPFYPAESFCEAVQAVWIIHFLTPLAENAWYSISLGKFDEYMYPFYKASLEKGMTRDETKKILKNFYELLNSYADGACLLNIGGEYNELSELLIECQKEFSLPAPILGARINDKTPEHIWQSLIDEKLFSMGQPTFYGESSCVAALVEKGVPKDKAVHFSNNSCMGIGLPGEDFNSMWGMVFNVSAALEAAVNCGDVMHNAFHIPGIGEADSIEKLYENFETAVKYSLDICERLYEKKAQQSEKSIPDPFVSLLTDTCIEKHCDRISGAKYHNVTVECMGMVNVSDGICAVDRLVFKEKKYTLEEMLSAVRKNYVGYEELRQDILACPKYGQNASADKYAVRVAEILEKTIRARDYDNRKFSPSLHTLDTNVAYGSNWGAGFDGRAAGTPFAKNAGCSNIARQSEPTSMALSAAKLPQQTFYGGQPIDVNFQADTVRDHKKEIEALIKVYFRNGGLQFQVNSLSSALLRDATDNPEKYPDLVVRIGGYSILFSSLSPASKEEFIERVAKEEC